MSAGRGHSQTTLFVPWRPQIGTVRLQLADAASGSARADKKFLTLRRTCSHSIQSAARAVSSTG